jgi:hypothetical protein
MSEYEYEYELTSEDKAVFEEAVSETGSTQTCPRKTPGLATYVTYRLRCDA